MFRRADIRYGNRWIRLLCCFGVGGVCWHLFRYQPIDDIEWALFAILQNYGLIGVATASVPTKVGIVLVLCVLPAVMLVERPLVMLVCGVSYAVLYAVVAGYVLFFSGIALPLAVPLIGIVTSTSLLETMAWSEERNRRKQLERIDAARQQFTDLLVHDLRRRLSSIQASLSLLRRSATPPDTRTTELLTTLGAGADRMLIQVNALLDVRKIQEGRMVLNREPVSLGEIFQGVLAEYRPTSELVGIQVEAGDSPFTPVKIQVDREIFSRVTANILWNALRHAPTGSVIRTGFEQLPSGGLEFFVVNDSDPIPPEIQKELFQAFVSGRASPHPGHSMGTGLGLTFCKLAIEIHGGTVRIESPLAGQTRGVKVVVSLPPSAVLRN
jgi:signal transduction histidine kinase